MSSPWSLRSWGISLAVALPFVLLLQYTGFEYPAWVKWIGIGVALVVGIAVLVSPQLAGTRSKGLALALGAIAIFAAVFGAYSEFQGAN